MNYIPWWNRRNVVKTAKNADREEAYVSPQEIREWMDKLDRVLDVLRKFAEKTPELKELMRRANLL